jgi:TPR repeat protein
MYRSGEGVSQDYKTALKWYTLAAEQGDVDAKTAKVVLEQQAAKEIKEEYFDNFE